MDSKAITISSLMKVDVGNLNAGWTEGVVTIIKKVHRYDGASHPYISGQAIRHYLRDTISELVHEEPSLGEISPQEKTSDRKAPIVTEGNPSKYIDDDLFGFMRAIKTKGGKAKKKDEDEEGGPGKTRRRESPLRVSPAFGLFPFADDRDLGTRSAVEATGSAEAGSSIFETEITNNIFRTTMLLELDRVGVWKGFETTDDSQSDGGRISAEDRRKRIIVLLKAIKYLWGGGRQARLLVDLTPQFLIYARMNRKVPIFLNSLNIKADKNGSGYSLILEPLREVIHDYEKDIQKLIVGIRSGFLTNGHTELQSLSNLHKITPMSVGDAIDTTLKDIENINFD